MLIVQFSLFALSCLSPCDLLEERMVALLRLLLILILILMSIFVGASIQKPNRWNRFLPTGYYGRVNSLENLTTISIMVLSQSPLVSKQCSPLKI